MENRLIHVGKINVLTSEKRGPKIITSWVLEFTKNIVMIKRFDAMNTFLTLITTARVVKFLTTAVFQLETLLLGLNPFK